MRGAIGEAEISADRDIGCDDVPVRRAVLAIRDVADGARDKDVVGAFQLVAVRVDVGDGGEVWAKRLAGDDGGINRSLIDGRAVGEYLPGFDGDGAVVSTVAAGGDAVARVRPAEGDVAVSINAAVIACGDDIAASNGHRAIGMDAVVGAAVGGDAAAVDSD